MPAQLPPSSGYTYALEYSVDEGLAAGATDVRFSQPLFHYVENFLNFPIGMAVPVGYYDKTKATWIPSDNGRVIKIISITGGLANLDTTGSGTIDNGAALGVYRCRTAATRHALHGRPKSVACADHALYAVGLQLALWPAEWRHRPVAKITQQ